MTMTFGSLFSGIEGFGVGLERSGMKCVWQAEKDESCLKVLRRHFPDVPKFTDVREINAASVPVRPDWICGGFPCQDLSVAGRRAGLAGERSGLFFEFMRIVGELTPGGVLIENVPGLLSSNEGRDMGIVLRSLDERGYGWAYRSFDAQYAGLAQRRERVFIVGCLGDMRRAAEILFERESLPWDSPPSRETRARTAWTTEGSPNVSGTLYAKYGKTHGTGNDDQKCGFGLLVGDDVSYCLNAKNGKRFDGESETLVASPLCAGMAKGAGHNDGKKGSPQNLILTHSLTSGGADASEDGTGRGTPVVPVYCLQHAQIGRKDDAGPQGKGWQENIGFTLDNRSSSDAVAFGFDPGQSSNPKTTDQLTINGSPPLPSGQGAAGRISVSHGMAVRRLTPRECERLQGFPDDWTRYADDGKEISDSGRYRMLGNAVAVPVSEWIGRRILEATQPLTDTVQRCQT